MPFGSRRSPRKAWSAFHILLLLLSPMVSVAQGLPHVSERPASYSWLLKDPGDIAFDFLAPRADTVTIFAMGDIMSHGLQMKNAWQLYCKAHPGASRQDPRHYDYSTFFKHVEDRIAGADLAVGNLEFPMAGPPFSGYPAFSAPDSYPYYIAGTGFDVLLTANNHIFDKGKEGVERTIRIYDELESRVDAVYTGIAMDAVQDTLRNPLMVQVRGLSVAIINFTYGTNSGIGASWPKVNRMDRKEIASAIGRARRRGADVILAFPHWGNEYQPRHSAYQEELAVWLARSGVDAIIGSHPHVVQDRSVLEVDRDGVPRKVPVVYSLGNAVSNQNDLPARLEACVVLKVVFGRSGVEVIPETEVSFLWCTKPGMLEDGYAVVPVAPFKGKKELWRDPQDYDNMISTYNKVLKTSGITDCE